MKKWTQTICLVIFLALCSGVVWFLHCFTVTDQNMTIIDWDSAAVIDDTGTETPYELDGGIGQESPYGTYIFKGTLPEGLGEGYLLFETDGLEMKLSLNGEEIYASSVATPDGTMGMSQANLPLPENASGELVLTCTVTEETTIFPPLLRFMPEGYTDIENFAYANYYSIPAGAEAVILILAAGLFLLGILEHKIDWSLIPLIIAASTLIFSNMNTGCGYYFLPAGMTRVLDWAGFLWIAPVALLAYLIMKRGKQFWKSLGIAVSGTLFVLLIGWIFSYITGGYLSSYLFSLLEEVASGYFYGLLYWLTLWLTVVAALISTNSVVRSFARQQANVQTMALRNRLITDNYQTLESKIRDDAALRHEFHHQLIALDALCQKRDYAELEKTIKNLREKNSSLGQIHFSENYTFNAILQDASSKCSRADIPFEAKVAVPAELNIAESDLCVLLMNMLDNAWDACLRIRSEKKRMIRFHAEIKNGFLAIKCENSYDGTIKTDDKGNLLTIKDEPELHGFGLTQMSAIAQKYHSILDINYSENNVFTVQTALKIPPKK
ncbi:MAG: GHKL domain-containing protein [Roseburia sp.]